MPVLTYIGESKKRLQAVVDKSCGWIEEFNKGKPEDDVKKEDVSKTNDVASGNAVENVDETSSVTMKGADASVLAGMYCDDAELVNTYGTSTKTSGNNLGLNIEEFWTALIAKYNGKLTYVQPKFAIGSGGTVDTVMLSSNWRLNDRTTGSILASGQVKMERWVTKDGGKTFCLQFQEGCIATGKGHYECFDPLNLQKNE